MHDNMTLLNIHTREMKTKPTISLILGEGFMKKLTYQLFLLVTAMVSGSMLASGCLPPLELSSLVVTPANCATGATVAAVVKGGLAPYTFSPAPSTQTGGTVTYANLDEGTTFTFIVNDSSTPAQFLTTTVNIATAQPVGITGVVVTNPSGATTNDGVIQVVASSGGAPVSYTLNGGSLNTTGLFSGLAAGGYTVTATAGPLPAGVSCTDSVAVTLVAPAPLTISATSTAPTCNGGSDGTITATLAGGVPPYTVNLVSLATGCIAQTLSGVGPSFTFKGLAAGSYALTASDCNGVYAALSTLVTVAAQTRLTISAASSETDASCNGGTDGSVTVVVNPTTDTITGVTLTNSAGVVVGSFTTPPFVSPFVFTGLPADTYTAKVTGVTTGTPPPAVGTADCALFSITVNQPDAITITEDVTNQDVINNVAGSNTITVAGGVAPYTIVVNPGALTQSGNGPFTFSNLAVGDYTVAVTDANGCTATDAFAVACSRGQSANALTNFITNVLCNGGCVYPPVSTAVQK